jgi:formylglycine-generating enzyme
MKAPNAIIKVALITLFTFHFSLSTIFAQNDTMYVMKSGVVVGKYNVNTQVDSVIFYKPTSTPVNPVSLQMVNIPSGTFTMGSPSTEVGRSSVETQYSVTLSAFRMSKYEVTNAQYATFLNAKGIGSNGKYAAGAYPTQALIYASYNWGLNYTGGKWVPVAGYENHPVINVTWYGATEFATYAGGTLPTEAQWEYACRAGTSTPFNTGSLLTNLQANYSWAYPYNGGTNTVTTRPGKTQAVGTYAANAWDLHDMHGNVLEWCSDWYGTYPTTAQTNPTGAATGSYRVFRGGGWNYSAQRCRSAYRNGNSPYNSYDYDIGFRVVLVP